MNSAPSSTNRLSTAVGRVATFIAACTLLALALGSLGRHSWLLDLLSHFRVHYFVVLALCGLGLLILHRFVVATVVLVATAAVGASIISYTGLPSQPVQAATESFRFVTYNRHYGNDNYAALGEWLARANADVLAMQEVDSMETFDQLRALLPGFPHVYAKIDEVYDVAIFSRWPIRSAELVQLSPGANQALKAVVEWHDQPLTLIGVHLHWPVFRGTARLRDAEFRGLSTFLRGIEGPLLVGGDMNITPWSPIFREEVERSGLQDCARGHGLVPSWPSKLPWAAIRIDHCLVSDHWRVLDITPGPSFGSDHRAMLNVLELKR